MKKVVNKSQTKLIKKIFVLIAQKENISKLETDSKMQVLEEKKFKN